MRRFRLELKSAAGELAAERLGFDWEVKFSSVDDGSANGEFEGYASIFNLLDNGGDIVKPGAFKESIAEHRRKKTMPALLWQHMSTMPIGVWTDMEEDEKGLKVKGRLLVGDVPQASIAHALMKAGAIKGLSIGYQTQDADMDRKTGARHIKKAKIWEVSPVTFPMMPEATVTAVKGDSILGDARAMEKAFREGGLTEREAKMAVAITKKMVSREGEQPEPAPCEGVKDALMSIRRATTLFA